MYREPDEQLREEKARERAAQEAEAERRRAAQEAEAERRRVAQEAELAAVKRALAGGSPGLVRAAVVASAAAIGLPVLIVTVAGITNSRAAWQSATSLVIVAGLGCSVLGLILGGCAIERGARFAGIASILISLVALPLSAVCAFVAMWSSAPFPSGRPFRVAGIRVLPRVVRGRRRGALDPRPMAEGETRRALAAVWLADARAEHASVTAFQRLAEDLALAGAPADLVAWARRAADEEIGHTEMCFAIASAYSGRMLRPGSLPFSWTPSVRRDDRRKLLERLAVDSLLDGFIAEGVAAVAAREGAEHAVDPAVRDALERIAREEATHAQLAGEIVAWIVREQPSVVPALFKALAPRDVLPAVVREDRGPVLTAHGRVASRRMRFLEGEARAKALGFVSAMARIVKARENPIR